MIPSLDLDFLHRPYETLVRDFQNGNPDDIP
jgi:hypothetical protein